MRKPARQKRVMEVGWKAPRKITDNDKAKCWAKTVLTGECLAQFSFWVIFAPCFSSPLDPAFTIPLPHEFLSSFAPFPQVLSPYPPTLLFHSLPGLGSKADPVILSSALSIHWFPMQPALPSLVLTCHILCSLTSVDTFPESKIMGLISEYINLGLCSIFLRKKCVALYFLLLLDFA